MAYRLGLGRGGGLSVAARSTAFALQFVVLDACSRGLRGYLRHPAALLGALASAALWTLLSRSATGRAARALLAVVAATVLVVDRLVYRYYGTWLDAQVAASAVRGWLDVRPIAMRLVPEAVALAVATALVEYAIIATTPDPPGPRARAALAVTFLACLAVTPAASLTPELRAASALSAFSSASRAAASAVVSVPVLPSSLDDVPSILLVITESVGASSYCEDPSAPCALSPEVGALLPDRVPLRQMRSLASYTALSVAVLLTGRSLVRLAAEDPPIASAPTLFDYVKASRVDGRPPWTAYWSAQAASVLPRDLRASVDSWVTLETLLGHGVDDEDDAVAEDMDGRLSARCVAELPRVPRPAFIVLHLLGTHAPYFFDRAHAPFQPTEQVISWAGLPHVANAYRDAVVTQDHALATCLRAFIDPANTHGAPWMILFTSDHGEAFGEHGAIHHGQNLYDEQVHVPAWIAAGNGALRPSQRENLAGHADAFVTHLDIVPTVLDALGVEDTRAIAPLRSHLGGRSLLAAVRAAPPLPMTNCTSLFPCPLNTWGMLGDGQALVAQPWDSEWNCVDLASAREHTAGPACDALRAASRTYFPSLPGGQANGPAR